MILTLHFVFSCSDGYLKIYLKGQEATDSYDKFDYELCGEESQPPPHVVSDGPRLVMVFSSGELQGGGFKAKYTFETGKNKRSNNIKLYLVIYNTSHYKTQCKLKSFLTF